MMIEYDYTTTGQAILSELRQTHGSLARLRRKVASGKASFRERVDLERWEVYLRPGRAESAVRGTRGAVFHTADAFLRMLTPERLRLLNALRAPGARYDSVHELARALGRDPKNVLNDLKGLAGHGLVVLDKRNARRTVPRAAVERVVITL